MNELTINYNSSIKSALLKMRKSQTKCLVVIKNNNLYGTISDGDIRNAILSGRRITERINKTLNKDCTYYYYKNFNIEVIKNFMIKSRYDVIPIVDDRMKVKKIVTFDTIFSGQKKENKLKNVSVNILAGGEGKRLRPYTSILPKPLMPLFEKTTIECIIDKFLSYSIKNFYISVNYKSNLIKAFFRDLNPKYKISYIEEDKPLGTAGSLKYLEKKIKTDFFSINCDTILDIDYYDAYKFHTKNNFILTIIASEKDYKIPYGTCIVDRKGHLKEIREKPTINMLVNTGLYIINPKLLKLIPKNKKLDFDHLIKKCLKEKKLIGVYPTTENFWLDVGNLKDYKKKLIN
jgi:dTDP-glucose pyrophosphorylase